MYGDLMSLARVVPKSDLAGYLAIYFDTIYGFGQILENNIKFFNWEEK